MTVSGGLDCSMLAGSFSCRTPADDVKSGDERASAGGSFSSFGDDGHDGSLDDPADELSVPCDAEDAVSHALSR